MDCNTKNSLACSMTKIEKMKKKNRSLNTQQKEEKNKR